MIERRRGVILDRGGARTWRHPDGPRLAPLENWDLTLVVGNLDGPAPADVEVIEIGELSEGQVRLTIDELASRGPIDAISTCSENYQLTLADLRDRHAIPGKGLSYVERFRDKWRMKEHARRVSVPCMDGALASDLDNWSGAQGSSHGFVLKPRMETGSQGVAIAKDRDELLELATGLENPESYLVERFSKGDLLHADGVVSGGRVSFVTSRYVRPCHVSGGRVPLSSSTLPEGELRTVAERFVLDLVEGWEMKEDVFHCEMFAEGTDLALCEVACRPGGAGVPAVVFSTRGIDLRHSKTLVDFGLDPWILSRRPSASHGGWTVIYPPGDEAVYIDDSQLAGHATREVADPLAPPIAGLAGVGIATYSFAEDQPKEVLALIGHYERGVRVLPLDSARSGIDTSPHEDRKLL